MRVDVKVHKTRRDVVMSRTKSGEEVLTCYVSQAEMDEVVQLLIKNQS